MAQQVAGSNPLLLIKSKHVWTKLIFEGQGPLKSHNWDVGKNTLEKGSNKSLLYCL